jgi:hypothetical protein
MWLVFLAYRIIQLSPATCSTPRTLTALLLGETAWPLLFQSKTPESWVVHSRVVKSSDHMNSLSSVWKLAYLNIINGMCVHRTCRKEAQRPLVQWGIPSSQPKDAAEFFKIRIVLYLFFFFFFFWYGCVPASVHVLCVCLVPSRARRGRQISENWSYKWLWAIMCIGV